MISKGHSIGWRNPELIFRRGAPPNTSYIFKHALVRDAAYESLLLSRRRQLHAKIAHALSARFPEVVELQPEVLAHHYTEAGLIQEAVDYWLRAGERALQRSEYLEAVGHLTKGLDVQQGLPPDTSRARQELAYQTALGSALRMTKGYGAEDTGRAFTRARELCEALGDTPQVFSVLYGLWSYQMVRARYRVVRDLSRQFLEQATIRQDAAAILVGHRLTGFCQLIMGEFSFAKEHLLQTLALYDPAKHRSLALQFAQDPRVSGLSQLAWLNWILGWPDQSLAVSREAVAYARELDHIPTHVWADWAALPTLQFRRDTTAIEAKAASMIAICDERKLSWYRALAAMFEGWALGQLGHSEAALEQMSRCLAELRTSGQVYWLPYFLSMQAETLAACGQIEAGLSSLAEALALVDSTGERWLEAEIHRLNGEVLHLLPRRDKQGVEDEFAKALRIARSQAAKSFELRAASSLARLWAEHGERQRAHDLLSPIYGWFTEGFDTPDLREAKDLLKVLMQ